jgi:hypothetical protein
LGVEVQLLPSNLLLSLRLISLTHRLSKLDEECHFAQEKLDCLSLSIEVGHATGQFPDARHDVLAGSHGLPKGAEALQPHALVHEREQECPHLQGGQDLLAVLEELQLQLVSLREGTPFVQKKSFRSRLEVLAGSPTSR